MIYSINSNAFHIPLADQSVQCVVTSPPYWGLRDYGTAKWEGGSAECDHKVGGQVNMTKDKSTNRDGIYDSGMRPGADASVCKLCGARRIDAQIGLESTPAKYVAHIVAVMRECWRVLKDDGVLWLNLGDSYARQAGDDSTKATDSGMKTGRTGKSEILFKSGNNKPPDGLKPKDLCGIPWRVAFALQDDGWYLRSDVIWHKPNPMPESVTDRPTKAHEYIFLLSKSPRYFYDSEAIKETSNGASGRNNNERNAGALAQVSKGRGLFGEIQEIGKEEGGSSQVLREWKGKGDFEEVSINGKGKGESTSRSTQAQGEYENDSMRSNSGSMDRNTDSPRSQMRDMWEEEEINERSYNPTEQRRATYSEQYTGSLSELQQQKEQQVTTRNRRSVWTVATQPYSGAHFATFPPALIEPMILAGTSARGECPHCGKAWVRVIERVGETKRQAMNDRGMSDYGAVNGNAINYAGGHDLQERTVNTLGWRPQCDCFEDDYSMSGGHYTRVPDPIPQIVLDPFAGSGTTGRVAVKHGRRAVLLDLNTKYIELQFERTSSVQITMGM